MPQQYISGRERPEDNMTNRKSQSGKPTKGRVSKAQWLEAGLKALESGGVEKLRVESLAKDLAISKSGFYWHFRDREHLLSEMQDYWQHEFTNTAAYSPMIQNSGPLDRLRILATMIREHNLTRYDLAFLAWAEHDENVRKTVEDVLQVRMDTVRVAFAELGYNGIDLEVRAQTFVSNQFTRNFLFPQQSKEVEDAQSEAFLKMLIGSVDQN